MRSLLSVVAAADNFPPHEGLYPLYHPTTREVYTPFHLSLSDCESDLLPVGLLRPSVLLELQAEVEEHESSAGAGGGAGAFEFVKERKVHHDGAMLETIKAVHFADWVIKEKKMTEVMGKLAEKLRSGGKYLPALRGWRNELYMIYAPPTSSTLEPGSSSRPFGNAAFALERAACGTFGLPTYGVHMTAYEGEGRDMKIWVPKRSATKSTYPGMLDNSVAGGIVAGMTPLETMIKECEEEASLPADLVKKHVRATGATTYFHISDRGNLQPEIEYTYDLPLPSRDDPSYILPKPNDDEVESFDLLTVPETIEALHSGNFKPNSGLILVDFLVRHNLITPEEEPSYLEIVWRTKRRLGFATPV